MSIFHISYFQNKMLHFPPSPLQALTHDLLTAKQITLSVKREDLLHPQLQGNKWRKLKYNIAYFLENKTQFGGKILTFGGAHSNHIYATAAAGKLLGIATIGVIRGERIEPLNATLAFAEQNGMHLHFCTRTDYRLRGTPEFSAILQQKFGAFYEIPEGGSNALAVQGVMELAQELPACDYVALAAGTGATAAGVLLGAKSHEISYKTLAFSVLKGGDFLKNDAFDFAKNHFFENKVGNFKNKNTF
jgi:1-aminocyclopropane-1-carboxylate deaminase